MYELIIAYNLNQEVNSVRPCIDATFYINFLLFSDLTQNSADLMVMAVLKKPSIKDVKMNHLHKLRKMFNLSLLRGKDKYTHVRAVANSLYSEGYIKIAEEANLASLTRDDISVVKTLDLED